ncbi:MAG TPA: hypothetical protein VHM65_04150, partial [Candidatus Lustribacter sp.]|nr:hypothetical protein [Candidatus Lustribacter sp.]
MSPLVMGSRRVTAVSADTLADQTEALVQALDAAGACLPGDAVSAARGVATKVAERMTMTGDHTVVALA